MPKPKNETRAEHTGALAIIKKVDIPPRQLTWGQKMFLKNAQIALNLLDDSTLCDLACKIDVYVYDVSRRFHRGSPYSRNS